MEDTLLPTLYLGKLSRVRLNYGKTKEPDHSWSEFVKMRDAFVQKHPELKSELKTFMDSEKKKWGSNFGEAFKKHSLALFVLRNVDRKEYVY